MATVPTTIRIDKDVKSEAGILLDSLGLDMSTAVNMFLRQLIIHNDIPFSVTVPHYKQEVLDAADEARRISRDRMLNTIRPLQKLWRTWNYEILH